MNILPNAENCVVFLELQFECKAGIACTIAELVQGVGAWVACCGHCVSSTRICV